MESVDTGRGHVTCPLDISLIRLPFSFGAKLWCNGPPPERHFCFDAFQMPRTEAELSFADLSNSYVIEELP